MGKITTGVGSAGVLVVGAHLGIVGLLAAVYLCLQAGALWVFIRRAKAPNPRVHPAPTTPPNRSNSPRAISARIALRERAHLQHGDYRRLRSLCEGEPRLLELMGMSVSPQPRYGLPIQKDGKDEG